MAFNLPTNLSTVEAWVGALYGYAVGSSTMAQVNTDITSYGGLNNTLNAYYSSAFGANRTQDVAAVIAKNLGIVSGTNGLVDADVKTATDYITGMLNGALATKSQGVAVNSIINLFSGLATDTGSLGKTFGTAAATWNATVANSVTYAASNASDALLSKAATVVATAAAVPSTATLTSGIDNITGNAAGNNSINGSDAVVGTTAQPTFTPGDTIALTGTNNVLNWITSAQITGTPAGSSVSGVQTANVSSTGNAALTLDVTSGYTGLLQLNVTNAATAATAATGDSVSVTAPATTNINATSANALTAGTITTLGGLGVSATLINAGVNGGVAANIGSLLLPAGNGAVVVTDSESIIGVVDATTYTAGGITTYGGSTVAVTQNIATDSASAATLAAVASTAKATDSGGAVKIYGTKDTKSVTVTQTAPSAPVAGSLAATGYTGVAGIVDGAVTIQDVNYASGTAAGTITSVSLTNYGNGSTITSSGLNTLTLASTGVSNPNANTPGYTASTAQSLVNNGTLTITNPLATTPVTALNLNLNGGSSGLITFQGAGTTAMTTLNIVTNTAATAASTAPFVGGQFQTINVSGKGIATLGASNSVANNGNGGFNAGADTGLTALNVSGAAGFSDGNGAGSRSGLNTFGSALTITNTGTGKFTAYIDDTTQSYVAGAAGTSVITVNADALKPITAGSGSADEIIFAAAPTLTAAGSGTNITGFEIFGVGVGATGSTFDMSKFASDKFTTIDVAASTSAGTYTFKNVTGNTLNIGTTSSGSNNVTYQVADANGSADSLTVNLGSTSAASGTVASYTSTLALSDASNQGVGTMVINANISSATGTPTNTVETINLTNTGLNNLTINGGAGVTIAGNQTISAPTLSITNNSSAANTDGSTWSTDGFTGSITDTILSTISYTGSHNFGVTGGITTSSPVMNVINTNTGTTGVLALGTVTDTSLVSINLKGSISGTFAPTVAAGNSFTLNGSTDNSNVSVTLTNGAGATLTDNITLGNGANTISDPSTAGTVNITAGTGANIINVGGTTNTTGAYNVTVGYHTSADTITVGNGGTFVTSAPNTVINGALSGDWIVFANDGTAPVSANTVSGAPSTAAAIAAIETTTAHAAYAAYVPSAGVTLIAENKSTTVTAGNESLVQVNGKQNIAWFGLGFGTAATKVLDVAVLNASTTGVTVPKPAAAATVALGTHTTADTLLQTTAFSESVAGFVQSTDKLSFINTAAELNGVTNAVTGVAVAAGNAVTPVIQSVAGATTVSTAGANILDVTSTLANAAAALTAIQAAGTRVVTFGAAEAVGAHTLVEYDDGANVHVALLTQGTAGTAVGAGSTLVDLVVLTGTTTHLTASNFAITAS